MNRVLTDRCDRTGTGATYCVQDGPWPPNRVGGGCDGCELMYEGMPKELGWQTSIAGEGEPGEPLEMQGVIYRSDGKTPAPEVILYVYHTDAKGYYSQTPGQAHGRRHGHLRLGEDESGGPIPFPNDSAGAVPQRWDPGPHSPHRQGAPAERVLHR